MAEASDEIDLRALPFGIVGLRVCGSNKEEYGKDDIYIEHNQTLKATIKRRSSSHPALSPFLTLEFDRSMTSTIREEIVVIEQSDSYNGSIGGSIVGGHGNTNTVNVHNHGLGQGFDKFAQRVAGNAMHNSVRIGQLPKSYPGIRTAILDRLVAWATSFTQTDSIIWLYGPPMTGKSVVLKTVADLLCDQDLLLASFFFSRSESGRDTPEWFITTIAYQIALAIPATRNVIVKAFEDNPLIFSQSLRVQAQALVIAPIRQTFAQISSDPPKCPRILVIDGIDECGDFDSQIEILQILGRIIQSLPIPFAFIVSSRPQEHIRSEFNEGELSKISSQLNLEDFVDNDADIKRYLTHRFSIIGKARPVPFQTIVSLRQKGAKWPSSEDIDKLVTLASGKFVYALMVEKFISIQKYPGTYLDFILQPDLLDLIDANEEASMQEKATSQVLGLARATASKSAGLNLLEVQFAGIGDDETVLHVLDVIGAKTLLKRFSTWQRSQASKMKQSAASAQAAATQFMLASAHNAHLPSFSLPPHSPPAWGRLRNNRSPADSDEGSPGILSPVRLPKSFLSRRT